MTGRRHAAVEVAVHALVAVVEVLVVVVLVIVVEVVHVLVVLRAVHLLVPLAGLLLKPDFAAAAVLAAATVATW